MTVRELIELNQMILDVVIEVRKDGGLLLDMISIGNDVGRKPEYPTRVPIKPEYAGNNNRHYDGQYKDAAYIQKSINAREDGKEYWETKWNRIPAKYLELEVFGWEVWSAYRGIQYNKYREGERINIVALPSGEKFFRPEPPEKQPEVDDNQMTIDDWFKEHSGGST